MYNLKRNAELYLVEYISGTPTYKHKLDIYPDYSFSQTFSESSYTAKTLHNPEYLHDGAVISSANPGNFSFTSPIPDQASYPIALKLASSVVNASIDSFDLYLVLELETFKLEKCVIESTTFNLSMQEVLTISFSGTGSRFSSFVGTIPGTLVSPVQDYTKIDRISIQLNSTTMSSIAAVNIDLSNSIDWIPNATLHDFDTMSYVSNYTLGSRIVSGSITQFLSSSNSGLFSDYSVTGELNIDIFSSPDQVIPLLNFNFPSVVFTRRFNTTDIITRVYDYRLTYNTSIVNPLYKGV